MPRVSDTQDRKLGPADYAINRAIANYEEAIKALKEAKQHTGQSKVTNLAVATGRASWGKKHIEEAILEDA